MVPDTAITGEADNRAVWCGALRADGSYSSIYHNRAVATFRTPYDDEIARLGVALNDTYVPYGSEGSAGRRRQVEQDKNVARGQGGAQRAVSTTVSISSFETGCSVKERMARRLLMTLMVGLLITVLTFCISTF